MDERTQVPEDTSGAEDAGATVSGPESKAGAPAAQDARQRTTFGRYRVLRRLGEGGMSVVWEAVHPTRDRKEALKVLHAHLCRDEQIAERFHREVRAMAGLSHDHVVSVYDAGEVDGELYYTMPSLPGPTLSGLLEKVRATGEDVPGAAANALLDELGLPASPVTSDPPHVAYARRIASVLVGVTDALASMHTDGFLHRDVKPSNLMFDSRTRLVIADFGLVRTEDQRITATDEWLGTPAYMSPEQIVPKDVVVDGRTDIYSLGVTLFELLTLELPHQGANVAETLSLVIAKRARSIREANPGLPRDLETIVARCLEPRPDDRYPDAARLAGDLAAFARGAGITTKPVALSTRLLRIAGRQWRPLAAGAVVLLVAGFLWFTRGARLSIRAHPEGGAVVVDGQAIGSYPLTEHPLDPGEHVVLLEPVDKRFKPLTLRVVLEPGGHRDLERILPAKDPADSEVLALLARLTGIEQTDMEGPATAVRSLHPSAFEAPIPIWPRGPYSSAPDQIVLDVVKDHVGSSVRLLPDDVEGAAPLQTWSVASQDGKVGLRIDDATRAAMTAGTRWRVVVVNAEGAERESTSFAMLDAASMARIQEGLARVARDFSAGDPAATLVRAEYLLTEGLVGSAYALAEAAEGQIGPRVEIARIALAALEKADLRDGGPWSHWVEVYQSAED